VPGGARLAAAGLIAGFFGMFLVFLGLYRLGWRVVVCEQGFVDCNLFRSRAWRWEEVVGVYQSITRVFVKGSYSHTAYLYRVRMLDGTWVDYTEAYENVALLGRRLQDEVAAAIAPRMEAAFAAGEWLDFDAVEISLRGIRQGRDEIAWADVEELGAERGEVIIRQRFRREPWACVSVFDIANLPLFSRLIGRATAG